MPNSTTIKPASKIRFLPGIETGELVLGGVAALAVGLGSMAIGEAYENSITRAETINKAERRYTAGLGFTYTGLGLGTVGGALVVGAAVRGTW